MLEVKTKMEIKSFTFGPFQTNTYVISLPFREGSGLGSHILLIDPACSNPYEQQQLETYISYQLNDSPKLSSPDSQLSIVATHGHLDHLWGAKWATEKWHTPVLMHEADIPMAKAMQAQYDLFGIRATAEEFPIESLDENKRSIFNLQFSIIPTPGHTPGSICLYFPEDKVLFSGDTLFQMGYGRTDLPGGNMMQLIQSLDQLFALPDDVRVYPGHGYWTTIGEERR